MPRVEQVQQKALDEFRQKNINSGKKKKSGKPTSINDTIIMFICLFFLLSLVFIQLVKGLTPKIDTSVGDNTSENAEEIRDSKMKVDDRLKLIQLNDKMVSGDILKGKESSIFNTSLDEPVVLPKRKHQEQEPEKVSSNQNSSEQTLDEKVSSIISKNLNKEQKQDDDTGSVAPKPQAAAPIPVSYKVYVGLYQTPEQAQTAKSIIKESTLGQNAFVKLTKEGYTLQIGSYSSKPQAEAMVQALRVNNFPLARMAEEK